jgi:hypothetical protein
MALRLEPAVLDDALRGAVFPLDRAQLVAVARENEAPPQVLSALERLPRRQFSSVQDVAGVQPSLTSSPTER